MLTFQKEKPLRPSARKTVFNENENLNENLNDNSLSAGVFPLKERGFSFEIG